jgi:hypothetical protein
VLSDTVFHRLGKAFVVPVVPFVEGVLLVQGVIFILHEVGRVPCLPCTPENWRPSLAEMVLALAVSKASNNE